MLQKKQFSYNDYSTKYNLKQQTKRKRQLYTIIIKVLLHLRKTLNFTPVLSILIYNIILYKIKLVKKL